MAAPDPGLSRFNEVGVPVRPEDEVTPPTPEAVRRFEAVRV